MASHTENGSPGDLLAIIMHNAVEDAGGNCECINSGGWLDPLIGYVVCDVIGLLDEKMASEKQETL